VTRGAPLSQAAAHPGFFARVRALLVQRAWPIAAFGVLVAIVETSQSIATYTKSLSAVDFGFATLSSFVAAVVFEMPDTLGTIAASLPAAVLGPVFADAMDMRGWRWWLVAAILTMTLVAGGFAVMFLIHDGPITRGVSEGAVLSNEAFAGRSVWFFTLAGLIFGAYCRYREHEMSVIAALGAAETARAQAEREVLESRLKVLQARVEPELLFAALAEAQALQRRDPVAADALLDDLIAYLRAALPQMRGEVSTVAREVALAAAYLKVTPHGRAGQLAIDSEVASPVANVTFAPMILLPLAHGAAAARPRAVSFHADTTGGEGYAISIILHGAAVPDGWADEALASVRTTLRQCCGSDAALDVRPTADGAAALMHWPAAGRASAISSSIPAVSSQAH
jgi:hypothetical protein